MESDDNDFIRLAIVSGVYSREMKEHVFTFVLLSLAFLTGGIYIGLTFWGITWMIAGVIVFIQGIIKYRQYRRMKTRVDALWNAIELKEKKS